MGPAYVGTSTTATLVLLHAGAHVCICTPYAYRIQPGMELRCCRDALVPWCGAPVRGQALRSGGGTADPPAARQAAAAAALAAGGAAGDAGARHGPRLYASAAAAGPGRGTGIGSQGAPTYEVAVAIVTLGQFLLPKPTSDHVYARNYIF